mmetsp:Transcript_15325/g.37927  ORF Transcript_15325/g.37927 Transcript_15325/m.37927 type:complete len:89 (+) Transcript_15325:2265-2531(+)
MANGSSHDGDIDVEWCTTIIRTTGADASSGGGGGNDDGDRNRNRDHQLLLQQQDLQGQQDRVAAIAETEVAGVGGGKEDVVSSKTNQY